MTTREEGRKRYPLAQNIWFAFKDIKIAGYRYYLYLFIDMLVQVLIPLFLVLIPGKVIELLQEQVVLEKLVLTIAVWMVGILIMNLCRVTCHQKVQWMLDLLREARYWSQLTKYWLSCDITKMENEEESKINNEAMYALYESDGAGAFTGFYGLYMYGELLFVNIAGFVIYAAMAGSLHIVLLLVLITTSILNCVAKKKGLKYQFTHMDEFWANSNRFWYLKTECNNLEKAKDMRMYHLYDKFKDLLDYNTKEAVDIYDQVEKRHAYANGVVSLSSFIQNGVAYLFLIYQLMHGSLAIAQFVVYIGVVAGFSTWITQIVESATNLTKISYSISLFRSFIEDSQVTEAKPTIDVLPCHTIVFEDVSFGYGDSLLFNHFQLELKTNEKIALVGINGAGKTTLIKLLCGLYKPSEGRILMDGIDIASMNEEQYRRYISILFQDVKVLPFSIAKNIACAWTMEEQEELTAKTSYDDLAQLFERTDTDLFVKNEYDEERVIESLKKAKLWDKVSSLPKGIHTVLTQVMDASGIRLSGGETQRLLLARALYKDAPVLILDEPTAALDPIAESELYEEYAKLCDQKISVFISHRLSSTRFCDRILFLEYGTIVEEGTHDSLMDRNGEYAKMYQIQSYYYQKEVEKHEAEL